MDIVILLSWFPHNLIGGLSIQAYLDNISRVISSAGRDPMGIQHKSRNYHLL